MSPLEFIETDYESVRGMSGRFAARVAVGLLTIQSSAGIDGGIAEIGVFEGRFFIALALALRASQQAVAVDTFDWPDRQVEERFKANVRRFVPHANTVIRRCQSAGTSAHSLYDDYGRRPRLIHIDADHTVTSLRKDMIVALDAIAPEGVLLIDDMLHPAYPELYDAVRDTLVERQNWVVCCVIDREDIVAASKFVICPRALSDFYQQQLQQHFPVHVWGMRAQFASGSALVLAREHRLAEVE